MLAFYFSFFAGLSFCDFAGNHYRSCACLSIILFARDRFSRSEKCIFGEASRQVVPIPGQAFEIRAAGD